MNAVALPDLAQAIEAEHLAATRDAIAALEHAIACGNLLLEAKAQVGHGGWIPWVEANLTFGDRQARKYMRAANHASAIRNSNADFTLDNAMAMLAERSTSHTLRVMGNSKSNEWYSPKEILDRAVEVLGAIDTDPAWTPASPVAAHTAYTIDDDGLAQRWHGRVYMNPPYGREIDDWIEKLVDEHDAGTVTEAIVLVPARVDTRWFRRLDRFPRCFVYGRLKYSNSITPAPFPNAIFYLGQNVAKFAAAFGEIGGIWVRFNGYAP